VSCQIVWEVPQNGEIKMRTSRYRLLATLSLTVTLLIFLTPGGLIEYLIFKISPWWPWPSFNKSLGIFPIDKFVHIMLFAVCGFFLTRGWLSQTRSWLPLFLVLIAYAGFTEILQYFVPGRGASVVDFLADGIGAAIGILLAVVFINRASTI
jgi:hypothetical protein